MPSSRALSADVAVSRVTVIQAYETLRAEGLIDMRRGAGTLVSPDISKAQLLDKSRARNGTPVPIDQGQKHLQKLYQWHEPTNVAFQPGIPAFDAFPRALWSRLLARQALGSDPDMLDYAHVGGFVPLRSEIARYLRSSRGVKCDPEQVIVVTSVRSAIAVASSVLWPQGSEVAVCQPGYKVASRVLTALGHDLLHLPADEDGVEIAKLARSGGDCVGLYLTPAHHWPTGVALSPDRRKALVDWAAAAGAWIIEDDYDSEFRFDSPPLAPLHALESERVIYVGTFSKTFAPSVRTAYLVVPRDHVRRFEERTWLAATEPPLHVQAALADLLSEGHFMRHVSRLRKLYERRRAHLVGTLQAVLRDRIRVVVPPGGLQIIAMLPDHVPAQEVSTRAAEMDLVARRLSAFDYPHPPPNGLQLGFAAVPEDRIEPGVRLLDEIIGAWF